MPKSLTPSPSRRRLPSLEYLWGESLQRDAHLPLRHEALVTRVGRHPDLPAGGHEEDIMAITERDRVR